jgi:hypothetical protein
MVKTTGPDADPGDVFGAAVAASGETTAITSPEDNPLGNFEGAVYFRFTP